MTEGSVCSGSIAWHCFVCDRSFPEVESREHALLHATVPSKFGQYIPLSAPETVPCYSALTAQQNNSPNSNFSRTSEEQKSPSLPPSSSKTPTDSSEDKKEYIYTDTGTEDPAVKTTDKDKSNLTYTCKTHHAS